MGGGNNRRNSNNNKSADGNNNGRSKCNGSCNNDDNNNDRDDKEEKGARKDREVAFKKAHEIDAHAPAGSWIQHLYNGEMFWRNNYTGECTHELFFSPSETSAPLEYRRPIRASFAPIFIENKKSAAPKTAAGEALKGGGKGNQKEKPKRSLRTFYSHPPWEELYHKVNGKKYWRHRDTGEERHNDPLW